MKMIQALFLAVAVTLTVSTVHAAEAPKGRAARPCLQSDLIGTWLMKSLSGTAKIDRKDPFLWPNQAFVFEKSGHLKEMTSESAFNEAALKKLENAAATTRYEVSNRGILTISKVERPAPERCGCTFMSQDTPAALAAKVPESRRAQLPEKGDVLLSYFGKNGKPVVTKSLKKIR